MRLTLTFHKKMITVLKISLLIILSNAGFAAVFKLPETGQTGCYDSKGAVISCASNGQDGAYSGEADHHVNLKPVPPCLFTKKKRPFWWPPFLIDGMSVF
jgi:hypothetical protein